MASEALASRGRQLGSALLIALFTGAIGYVLASGLVQWWLSRPDLDEKTQARLLRVQRAEQQCTDLINALLLLSRNERGHGSADVARIAEQLLDTHRAQLRAKALDLRLEGEHGLMVDAPDAAVAVALGNLVGNAVKYTAHGEVVVRLLPNAVEVIVAALRVKDAARQNAAGKADEGTRSRRGSSLHRAAGVDVVEIIAACARLPLLVGDVRPDTGGMPGAVLVTTSWSVPEAELSWRFSRSSGPGGQGVNTTDSRAELSFHLAGAGSVPEHLRERAVARLGGRLVAGVLTVAASEHRSQLKNREAAVHRLVAVLREAVAPPPRARRPTRPSRGAKERRLSGKRQRSEIKRGRSGRHDD